MISSHEETSAEKPRPLSANRHGTSASAETGPSFTIPSSADFLEVAEVVDRRRRVAGVGSVGRREVECVVELQAVREVAVEPVRNDIVILLGLLEECYPDDSNIIS